MRPILISKAMCVLLLSGLWLSPTGAEVTEKPQRDEVDERADDQATPKSFTLPGLTVNLDEGYVDLDATICLDRGYLELIACTVGSKEHESVVAVTARPQHIHAALLLAGASNGHPAMHRQIGEDDKRWVHFPPRGDRIRVSLLVENRHGQVVERSISEFVMHIEDADVASNEKAGSHHASAVDGENLPHRFPDVFIFAGSLLVEDEAGARVYLADRSGHVITVATFGDEVLCLEEIHSADNAALLWKIDPQTIPPVGTTVTLRLTPHKPDHDDAVSVDRP